jgi:hypothetical protein
MSGIQTETSRLFVRNENGRGFHPTVRGRRLLRVWDVLSWVVAVIFFGTLLMQGSVPVWLLLGTAPFFIAPWAAAMFFSGRGPIGSLVHYARRMKGQL